MPGYKNSKKKANKVVPLLAADGNSLIPCAALNLE